MTGAKFKAALQKIDMTQRAAAKYFGVNERTIRNWVSGRSRIPKAVADGLRSLVEKQQ